MPRAALVPAAGSMALCEPFLVEATLVVRNTRAGSPYQQTAGILWQLVLRRFIGLPPDLGSSSILSHFLHILRTRPSNGGRT